MSSTFHQPFEAKKLKIEIFKFYLDEKDNNPLLNRFTIENNPTNQKSNLYINDVLLPLNIPIQVRFLSYLI